MQATDFYLQVERRPVEAHARRFHITVKSALEQPIPDRALVWNPDDFVFEAVESLSQKQLNLM